MKKGLFKILLILLGITVGLSIGELLLRIYNPLPSKVVGNSIRLLKNYQRTIAITDPTQQTGLDSFISYSTNSIGFRGADPPPSFASFNTIFTVGGSTTECSLLNNNKTWTYVLGMELSQLKDSIWINNAGIDGCSTFGHQVLLDEHIFKYNPDMILFLVGVNDMHVATNQSDHFLNDGREYILRNLSEKSELFSFLWNLYRQTVVKKHSFGHMTLKEPMDLSKEEFKRKSDFHIQNQPKYKQRLNKIIGECIERKIEPVLITQPLYKVTNFHPYYFVKYYNETTLEVGRQNNILVIDLAAKLDDNPDYYYDAVHYTNTGAAKVGHIIFEELANNIHLLSKDKQH